MRKGDETRQEILRISEKLFCTRGYEQTSIQDILDILHGSKGGFYHHFAGKDDVLKTICAARAQESAEKAASAAAAETDPLKRLNLVLRRFMPLEREDLAFMSMLIPILDRPESLSVRAGYQDALAAAYGPALREAVDACAAAGLARPVHEDADGIVMLLLNSCWVEVAAMLLKEARAGRRTGAAELLSRLQVYRACVETLLDAPFGSIELAQPDAWSGFADEVFRRMKSGAPTA